MSTDDLILGQLRGVRGVVDRLAEDMREVKGRLGIRESQVGGLTAQCASLSNRLDRMHERVARIERRLVLHEA